MHGVPANSATPGDAAHLDLTGQHRLAGNVLVSSVVQLVLVAGGFVMPRLIHDRLGQAALGVWDLGWSTIAYFTLLQGGVISAITREVSRYRAVGNVEGVNRVASSASVLLAGIALLVLSATLLVAKALPQLAGPQLGSELQTARQVLIWLGGALAIEFLFAGFAGVLTGCHRWDLHNWAQAATSIVTVASMATALTLGAGLPTLAAIVCLGELIGRVARIALAYRVLPTLRIRPVFVSLHTMRGLLTFGGKSLAPRIATLLVNQTTNIMILGYLGPAALAVYARPRALLRQLDALVSKWSFVFTPTASALQARQERAELPRLLVMATRCAASLVLPAVALLVLCGGPLLHYWMGVEYERPTLLTLLTLGLATTLLAQPLLQILAGLDAHGRAGFAQLLAGGLASACVLVVLRLDFALEGVAAALVIPLTLVNGVWLPFHTCHRLELPLANFLRDAFGTPLIATGLLVLTLFGIRAACGQYGVLALGLSGLAGVLTVVPMMWMLLMSGSRPGPRRLSLSLAEATSAARVASLMGPTDVEV